MKQKKKASTRACFKCTLNCHICPNMKKCDKYVCDTCKLHGTCYSTVSKSNLKKAIAAFMELECPDTPEANIHFLEVDEFAYEEEIDWDEEEDI